MTCELASLLWRAVRLRWLGMQTDPNSPHLQGCDPVLNHPDHHKNPPNTVIKISSHLEENRLVWGIGEATTHLGRWTRSPVHVGRDSPHVLAKRTFPTRQTGSGHRGQDTLPLASKCSNPPWKNRTLSFSSFQKKKKKSRRISQTHTSNNSYTLYYVQEWSHWRSQWEISRVQKSSKSPVPLGFMECLSTQSEKKPKYDDIQWWVTCRKEYQRKSRGHGETPGSVLTYYFTVKITVMMKQYLRNNRYK